MWKRRWRGLIGKLSASSSRRPRSRPSAWDDFFRLQFLAVDVLRCHHLLTLSSVFPLSPPFNAVVGFSALPAASEAPRAATRGCPRRTSRRKSATLVKTPSRGVAAHVGNAPGSGCSPRPLRAPRQRRPQSLQD